MVSVSERFTAELYVHLDGEDILLARNESAGSQYVGRLRGICEDAVEEMWIREVHNETDPDRAVAENLEGGQ